MFLLDTSILSHAQKPRPSKIIAYWLRGQRRVAIPFPVILEIQQGILEISLTKPHKAEQLSMWLEEVLSSDFAYPEINIEVAKVLARLT